MTKSNPSIFYTDFDFGEISRGTRIRVGVEVSVGDRIQVVGGQVTDFEERDIETETHRDSRQRGEYRQRVYLSVEGLTV